MICAETPEAEAVSPWTASFRESASSWHIIPPRASSSGGNLKNRMIFGRPTTSDIIDRDSTAPFTYIVLGITGRAAGIGIWTKTEQVFPGWNVFALTLFPSSLKVGWIWLPKSSYRGRYFLHFSERYSWAKIGDFFTNVTVVGYRSCTPDQRSAFRDDRGLS